MIDRRHEDEKTAGHRDVRREAGALRPERLLDDLDENFLAFFEEVLDPRLGAVAIVTRVPTATLAVPGATLGGAIGCRDRRGLGCPARFDEHRIGDLGRDWDHRRIVIFSAFETL